MADMAASVLAKTFDFDGTKLQEAIFETLQNRGTPYEKDSFKRVVLLANDEDMKRKWKYFLKNIKDESLEFALVIDEIRRFLEPVFDAIIEKREWQHSWDSLSASWLQIQFEA